MKTNKSNESQNHRESYTILEFIMLSKMYSPERAVEVEKYIWNEHRIGFADEWLNSKHFNETPLRTIKALRLAKKLGITCKLQPCSVSEKALKIASPERIHQHVFYHTERLAYWKRVAKIKGVKLEEFEATP
jgi:hypothetical protein